MEQQQPQSQQSTTASATASAPSPPQSTPTSSPMETKDQLVANVKEWIRVDTEIAAMKLALKEKNNEKKTLTSNLLEVMKSNKIDGFDINDGSLVLKTNKIKKQLNGKTLLSSLKSYYKTDPSLAENVTKYILDNREVQLKEKIVKMA